MPKKKTDGPVFEDAADLEAICQRIEAGDSQAEIAASLGVSQYTLSVFLAKEENTKRSARARLASAEAWLDKGLKVIESALDKQGGIDASAAKAYEQACARRAALRNPAYRDKHDHTLTGADGGPVETVTRIELVALK
ncbi:MAG: hypothetical protein ACRCV9_12380 [Burkholderiaceae bacterium]